MNAKELGDFLRARREALRPADIGLASGGSRNTPGLRREEVAAQVGMSVVRYGRLERGSASPLTPEPMAGLARVLRLDTDGFSRLSELAGLPEPKATDLYVKPGLMYVFDSLSDVPAYVLDDVTTIIARNSLAAAVFGPLEGHPANMTWRWFAEPRLRSMVEPSHHHDTIGRTFVSALRVATGWGDRRHQGAQLVAELAAISSNFVRLWESGSVVPFEPIRMTINHPVGPLDVSTEIVHSSSGDHRILLLRPDPGTPTRQRLDALKVDIATPSGIPAKPGNE